MSAYSLTGDDGVVHDLDDVAIDDSSDSVSFVAPFRTSPGSVCELRRTTDGATIKIAINNFSLTNGRARWGALALVRPRR